MTKKNLEIERLRAVAVLLTVFVHVPFKQLFSPYLYSPFTGVDLFFVISGFVVTLSFLDTLPQALANSPMERLRASKQSVIAFYLRRLFRIAPTAFFYIFIYWVTAVLMKASGSVSGFARPADIFREGIAFAGGVYNYAMVYGAIPTNMSHYYSLSIEEHFYFLAPILLVVCGRTYARLSAAFLGVFLVIFVARPMSSVSIANLSHTRFDELLYGVIIALLVREYRHSRIWRYDDFLVGVSGRSFFLRVLMKPPVRQLAKTATGFSFCMLLALLPGVINTDLLGGSSDRFFVSSAAFCSYAFISVVLVVLASLERGWIFEIPLVSKLLEGIGARSYSIYLGHVLLILVYNDLYFRFYEDIPIFLKLTTAGYAIQFSAFLIVMFGLAEITYAFVERPFRHLGAKVIASLDGAAA
jgi:peptidoglycan/LPS O-acetylase OafA/YrhL